MAIRISKTSKLNARSWSLEARSTCPGAMGANGELVDACKGCYAASGNYRFKNVKAPRIENREDWKRDSWVDDMVAELESDRYFRWFDSGDMYDVRLARKILEVMERTPWVNHWLPTRMHKFDKFASVIEAMQQLPNVVVRPSSDSIRGEYVEGLHGSVIIGSDQAVPVGAVKCEAYERDGKCGSCRACWSKDVALVAYVQHGRSMATVNRQLIARVAA